MARVVLKNLTKRFGNVIAVDNLSLEVREGEFLTALGPSGCGKSTTLNLIAGLEEPDEGEIYIGEELVNDIPPKDRGIAMVFQSYALYPHMSVHDNLSFSLRLRKYPKEEIKKRVEETAKILNLTHLLNRKPRQLSGGEQQRAALGRAIVQEPKVFLLDEPLSNLDAQLRVNMRTELKKLHERLKTTIIYVTHDQLEAIAMSNRVALMRNGKIEQLGLPNELYDNPRNLFVAGFIGSPPMNLIDATLEEKDNKMGLNIGGSVIISVPSHLEETFRKNLAGPELVLGIRPEDISVYIEPVENVIECEVYAVEPLGPQMLLTLEMYENLVKVTTGRVFGMDATRKRKVLISLDQDKMHFFDKKTGKAI